MQGVKPYINFAGNCKEAIEFYTRALDAELLYSGTYGDSPMAGHGPDDAIMHATVQIGDTHLMMSDSFVPDTPDGPGNISLALGTDNAAQAKKYFDNLADGGTVTMPLEKTFWAEAFGMLTDKFGINWMVNCEAPHDTV